MTNPGHIDPGYIGHLRFTVINMAAEPFQLRTGDAIATLLFFRLAVPVNRDFHERTGLTPLPNPTWDEVNRLAKDFVDVEARARAIAEQEVKKAQEQLNRLDSRTKWTTAIIGGVAGLLGIIGTLLVGWLSGMQDLKQNVSDLKNKVDLVEVKDHVTDLDKQLTELTQKINGLKK